MMRVICPIDPTVYVEHPMLELLGREEIVRVEAVLIKYVQDGGGGPARFELVNCRDRRGRPVIDFRSTINGRPWQLMV